MVGNDNAVARGLLHAMKSYSDVLPKLTALSLIFREKMWTLPLYSHKSMLQ